MTRREVFVVLSVFASAFYSFAERPNETLPSKIYRYKELPVKRAGGLTYRDLFTGTLFEGCPASLHVSELAPHSSPHPPHKHRHDEMVLVIEGELEFTVKDASTRAGAGSVLFAASNDLHGITNPGAQPAKYFVLALGADGK